MGGWENNICLSNLTLANIGMWGFLLFQEPLKHREGKSPVNWNHLLELMLWQVPVFLELVQSILSCVEPEKSTKITYRPINIFDTVVLDGKSTENKPSKCETPAVSVWPLPLLHSLLYSCLRQEKQSLEIKREATFRLDAAKSTDDSFVVFLNHLLHGLNISFGELNWTMLKVSESPVIVRFVYTACIHHATSVWRAPF